MSPAEVEQWLQGLGSLLSREALSTLVEEVRQSHMDGAAFDSLVASRVMPSLGDTVRPNHMAILRRCWNARKPSKMQSVNENEKLENLKERDQKEVKSFGRFDPPPRAQPDPIKRELSVEIPGEAEVDKEPDTFTPLSSALQKQKASRPPQVPRLDLSFAHNKVSRTDSDLLKHEWKDERQGRPSKVRDSEAPKRAGFANASAEDQQQIAQFYGYRDDGFIATMNGLHTDMIRPGLYVGNMADAAYWPFLKELGITHVINCSVEAQKVAPAYESKGIQYLLLPWQDREEEAVNMRRQRFRSLREATQYIKRVLKAKDAKNSILVHCVRGVSRSPAPVCAYLMEYEGLSFDRALSEVQSKHKDCLTSSHWQTMLHKFDAELLRGS